MAFPLAAFMVRQIINRNASRQNAAEAEAKNKKDRETDTSNRNDTDNRNDTESK